MQVALVERARAGDEEAFASLARAAGDRLLAIAYRILRDLGLAEDAVRRRSCSPGGSSRCCGTSIASTPGCAASSSTPATARLAASAVGGQRPCPADGGPARGRTSTRRSSSATSSSAASPPATGTAGGLRLPPLPRPDPQGGGRPSSACPSGRSSRGSITPPTRCGPPSRRTCVLRQKFLAGAPSMRPSADFDQTRRGLAGRRSDTSCADGVLDAPCGEVHQTPQGRRWSVPWRTPTDDAPRCGSRPRSRLVAVARRHGTA